MIALSLVPELKHFNKSQVPEMDLLNGNRSSPCEEPLKSLIKSVILAELNI